MSHAVTEYIKFLHMSHKKLGKEIQLFTLMNFNFLRMRHQGVFKEKTSIGIFIAKTHFLDI